MQFKIWLKNAIELKKNWIINKSVMIGYLYI